MSRLLVAQRALTVPGWAKDALWRNARAVPSLDLRFADNKSLTDAVTGASLVTFTRASTGAYVGSDGLIKSATTNEARFDHNPTTGESLGLLVEEARTNLLVRSEDFSTSWPVTNATVSTNNAIAPNGNLIADSLIETSATALHYTQQIVNPVTSGASYLLSVYAKANTRSSIELLDPYALVGRTFNLSNGTTSASQTGAGAPASFAIQPVGDGWYRCSIGVTASGTSIALRITISNGSATSYTGDGTSGIYVWGAQLEAGAFPTSYIPTTSATVTRAADVASITGSAFTSFYSQSAGTLFTDARTQQSAGGHIVIGVSTGSFASSAYLSKEPDNVLTAAPNASPSSLSITLSSVSSNVGLKSALAFTAGTGSASAVMNGGTVGTDASTGIPITMSQMGIGTAPWNIGSNLWNGHIARLTYWPTRLPNTTLQQITQ